ncbi:MAG TPA: hypothetical protein PK369_05470 [Thermoclostridium sp.]|nr:hypothetical protein [Thermoclostridium sp.]HPU45712.1 hypothetical protein [Thermoclostridium sp.]
MAGNSYEERTHYLGKIWIWTAVIVFLLVPVSICIYYNAWPPFMSVLKGLLGVAPIYWTVGVIEVITFTPMLGTGGTYLAFVTGNLTNLKVPCAINAMEINDVKSGTEEGDIVSTIAVATSSIVTTLIIAVGVILLGTLTPILNSPTLKPAFDNILPALFGALGLVYISKNWKLAVTPMVFMAVLFIAVPSLSGSVGVLVPVGAIISIAVARLLYKKNMI